VAKVKNEEWVTASGRVITEEIAEEIAEEAERGYDLSKAKFVLVGRPSLSGDGTSPRMSFRVATPLYETVKKRAEEEGRSVSDLAREALLRYVGIGYLDESS
jgi:hypothetical protein